MIGWIGDFFRFWWALFYWNIRKTWFRLRGAHRDDCPCQNYSDSGVAYQSRCEAIVHWQQPARFRRVCPLLVQTPEGWRCSAEAERVRPFWGRATGYAGSALLVCYLLGTAVAYFSLHAAHYDTGYLTVAWPPHWKELRGAQERVYSARAQAALAKGNFQEAILSLEMVCQLNPHNYSAGLALAGLMQASNQPYVSEHVYERLMHDVPEHRLQTAQIWFRTLLARGAYERIMPLAAVMLSEDPEQRGAWLNALLFSARQSRASQFLAQVQQENPHLPEWCTELINLEQLLLDGRMETALPRLTRTYRPVPADYVPYFQVERLLLEGRADEANTLLTAYGSRLPADEAGFLRLRVYEAKRWTSLLNPEFETLLQFPMTPRLAAEFCAYLVAYPAAGPLAGYFDRFTATGPALSAETVPLYQATYLAAALAGDNGRAEKIRAQIMAFTSSDARVLGGLVELLKTGKPDPRFARILPLVPLPTEVVYTIVERQDVAAPTK